MYSRTATELEGSPPSEPGWKGAFIPSTPERCDIFLHPRKLQDAATRSGTFSSAFSALTSPWLGGQRTRLGAGPEDTRGHAMGLPCSCLRPDTSQMAFLPYCAPGSTSGASHERSHGPCPFPAAVPLVIQLLICLPVRLRAPICLGYCPWGRHLIARHFPSQRALEASLQVKTPKEGCVFSCLSLYPQGQRLQYYGIIIKAC